MLCLIFDSPALVDAAFRLLLNRVDTSTAPDIEWPANPVRE
ncbi:tail fiber assembly protein [Escherichia coli]|nr:tail fiber assembly protein [Escherichia coli]